LPQKNNGDDTPMKELTKNIKRLLTENPAYRDNDQRLLVRIWVDKLGNELYNTTVIELMRKIRRGEMPNSSSIIRCRAKLQEIHPHLRGKLYEKRHKRQKAIIEELDEIKTGEQIGIYLKL